MRGIFLHLFLFVLTVLSTLLVGGVVYSATLLSILLAHEMGHYLISRRHRVRASLPYFIPFPFPPFGTLGAVIKTRSPIPDRKALFDIGVAGPLAGLCLAVPAIGIGLMRSEVVEVAALPKESLVLGNPPLFALLQRLLVGQLPEGYDLLLHPMAYAGWVGLFVTALNLLPVGQLDGGHVIYALFGRLSPYIFKLTMAGIVILCLIFNLGWLVLVLLLLAIGYRHPPPLDDLTPLGPWRKVLGVATMAVFFASFTPVPFPTWSVGLKDLLKLG